MTVRDPATLTCREVVELVSDFLGNDRAPDDRIAIEQHLLVCPRCSAYTRQIRGTIELTRRLTGRALRREPPHRVLLQRSRILPVCLGRRMCARAANLIEYVLPEVALRQWVLTFRFRGGAAARAPRGPGKTGAPKASLDDVRTQLEHLAPADLFLALSRTRLAHVPRYLRAIQVRLERLPNGPQKDLAKAEQVDPFWRQWRAHHASLRARGVPAEDVEAFRWLLEEYRVSVFAPELRAAVPVSAQRLTDAWQALVRDAGPAPLRLV